MANCASNSQAIRQPNGSASASASASASLSAPSAITPLTAAQIFPHGEKTGRGWHCTLSTNKGDKRSSLPRTALLRALHIKRVVGAATSSNPYPPNVKQVQALVLVASHAHKRSMCGVFSSAPQRLCEALRSRLGSRDAVVVLKATMACHHLLRASGNGCFCDMLLSQRRLFDKARYSDEHGRQRLTRLVRCYGAYMLQLLSMRSLLRFPTFEAVRDAVFFDKVALASVLEALPVVMYTVRLGLDVIERCVVAVDCSASASKMVVMDVGQLWSAVCGVMVRLRREGGGVGWGDECAGLDTLMNDVEHFCSLHEAVVQALRDARVEEESKAVLQIGDARAFVRDLQLEGGEEMGVRRELGRLGDGLAHCGDDARRSG
ncbi:hypothetical protein BWQ96_10205 [Gracilariopsis chorda]|uniref:ENTH domain-containing protein n=1 Tax=Gracilariopsis chorda TaxID=448386 RepID=A0A2V3IDB7_9FLOR|nr:hypothetical protein BWQ96_10205 [Gracilariopsis chorda]|eukprot:PXF40079.1 hypothetical protein BWQ96_10205 [Gracilariopsis chorda]